MKLNKEHIPLYYQLEQVLRKKITSDDFSAGKPLPTENDLCKEFGVSRTTVRQAFTALINEGLITRIPGKGTFLAQHDPNQKVVHYFNTTQSLADYLTFATLPKKIHHKGLVNPSIESAQLFDILPSHKVYTLRGIRLQNDVPLCYFIISILPEYADLFAGEDIKKKPVLTILIEKLGTTVQKVNQKIRTAKANDRLSKFLCIKKDDPVLILDTAYYIDDKVVETGLNYFNAELFHYKMELIHKI